MKFLKMFGDHHANPEHSVNDEKDERTSSGGWTPLWTWIALSLAGLIFAIAGATSLGFFGFVFGGLFWLGCCLAFSAIFRKTA
jgi:hypothetical protein